jgi:hypothetical protein
MNHRVLLGILLCGAFVNVRSQDVSDFSVRLSATVETSPARISMSWPADRQATSYAVYRKSRDAKTWTSLAGLSGVATNFVDPNVSVGASYEYRVSKLAFNGSTNYTGEGYLYSGIQAPLVDSRGKVILLVESRMASGLAMELTRLQWDLVGDGWTVIRHDVSRSNSVTSLRGMIQSDYVVDPTNVKTVFLLGHIPVPYSGNMDPDGHIDHGGAWPADVYYGEMNGVWTDNVITNSSASDPRNWNVRGDGKFDQSLLPSDVELQVGRVDLSNLPAFGLSETDLLRGYLSKDHDFRFKAVDVESRGLIDDHLGYFKGEVPAANGWRNFAALLGDTNMIESDWQTDLASRGYLWGFGCGSGEYTSCAGVTTTSDLAAGDPRVVFTMLFGSRFGDWDSPNDLLRAAIATPTYTLTSAWAVRPNWHFHHMAMGETIGFSTRLTQNNSTTYVTNYCGRWIHVALMGDPTLRMHPVVPPSCLVVNTNPLGGIELRWNASPEANAGYHVYRASNTNGPFNRLTSNPIATTNYVDPANGSYIYMVRAVKLEISASGSYYNPSQGIFQNRDGSLGPSNIFLLQPTNNATYLAPSVIQLRAKTFDPANEITNVAFYVDDVKLGECHQLPYRVNWSSPALGNHSVSVRAFSNRGSMTQSSNAVVRIDNGGAPRLSITALPDGQVAIMGAEAFGRSYRLQFLSDLNSTNWQTLDTAISNSPAWFQFMDSTGSPQRFYRTVFP